MCVVYIYYSVNVSLKVKLFLSALSSRLDGALLGGMTTIPTRVLVKQV